MPCNGKIITVQIMVDLIIKMAVVPHRRAVRAHQPSPWYARVLPERVTVVVILISNCDFSIILITAASVAWAVSGAGAERAKRAERRRCEPRQKCFFLFSESFSCRCRLEVDHLLAFT